MPKYDVTIRQSLYREWDVAVEAADSEDAKEEAYDQFRKQKPIDWDFEKVTDSEYTVSGPRASHASD